MWRTFAPEGLRSDARVILHLLRGLQRHGTHTERLEAFYAPQAHLYDRFRERLLQGRQTLMGWLAPGPGERMVELGGGTGRNLLFLEESLLELEAVEVVDLCPALLDRARLITERFPNVRTMVADAVSYRTAEPVDIVYFSYALTMIPDWRGAIENAISLLKPGGRLGVVDFYVSAKYPSQGEVRHSAFTRHFWPRWFAHDGVHLSPETLRYLRTLLPDNRCLERRAAVPYLPGLRVPYYIFVGRKKMTWPEAPISSD